MSNIPREVEVMVVWTALSYFFRGGGSALSWSKSHRTFRDFAIGWVDIQSPEEFRKVFGSKGYTPDYRGLICCVMDDLRMQDFDQRDRILLALTGEI